MRSGSLYSAVILPTGKWTGAVTSGEGKVRATEEGPSVLPAGSRGGSPDPSLGGGHMNRRSA